MGWMRKGRIFDPAEYGDWAGSHAQVPTALLCEDRVRVYYADRGYRNVLIEVNNEYVTINAEYRS